MNAFFYTYVGWFVTEIEWFISQDVGQYFQVMFAKFLDFLWFVHTNSLCFYFLASLEPLNMRQPYQDITLQGVVGIQRKTETLRQILKAKEKRREKEIQLSEFRKYMYIGTYSGFNLISEALKHLVSR